MRVGLDRPQIVDADDIEFLSGVLQGRAHHQPADPPEPVDRNLDRHRDVLRKTVRFQLRSDSACAGSRRREARRNPTTGWTSLSRSSLNGTRIYPQGAPVSATEMGC